MLQKLFFFSLNIDTAKNENYLTKRHVIFRLYLFELSYAHFFRFVEVRPKPKFGPGRAKPSSDSYVITKTQNFSANFWSYLAKNGQNFL